jgi:hypothetical protein
MKLNIKYEDGTSEVVSAKPKVMVAFEAAGNRIKTDEVSWLYKLAWIAKGRPGEFEQFLDSLEDVTSVDSDDSDAEVGPTSAGSANS